ncbi:MAG TPA: PRC-barrel domain-containing protein [Gammaproteobacteria bacterium]|nr:PRC-barrel domain-containing protein [Gammaproteobacteria bacterium]
MRASEFIGAMIVGRDGRQLGRVSDLLLDELDAATICYALVEVARPAQGGQRTVAVPWSLLRPARAGEPLVLGVSRETLQGLRAVERS